MKKIQKLARSFALELGIYAVLVTAYFYLVLHFLGGWLKTEFDADRPLYAVVSLLLIIGQGVLLQAFTTWLLALVRLKTE